MAYTLGSLFTGIGGIDLAFQRVGFTIAFQVEIDEYCNQVLAKHWPNVARHRDVKTVGSHNLATVDVLAGGFPCQDISAAGKGAGIKEGTRSGLWFEFARIIGEIRPRIVFLENVAAITSRDGTRVIADLTALGYDAEWGIIPASAAGASHRRERWWCVAYPTSIRGESRWPECQRQPRSSALISDSALADTSRSRAGMEESRTSGSEWQYTNPQQSALVRQSDGQTTTEGVRASISNVVDASSVRRKSYPQVAASFSQGKEDRRLQEFEGASCRPTKSILGRATDGLPGRLDGAFPVAGPGQAQYSWEKPRTTANGLPDRTSRLKALGNAVYVPLVQIIAQAVRETLEARDRLPDVVER